MARPGGFGSFGGDLQERLASRAAAERNRERLVQKLKSSSRNRSPTKTNGHASDMAATTPGDPSRFRVQPKKVDQIAVGRDGRRVAIPHIVRMLLNALLQSEDR